MPPLRPDTTDRLTAMADATAAEFRCPTVSWGVVRGGELVGHNGAPNTVYRIASMTKSFTTAAVLGLRDEGVLALDVPVAEYAPELGPVVGPPGSAAITLRHLLSMTSGLATDDAWADRHLDIDQASIDRVYAAGPTFAHRPGSAYEYSNLGFAMIGRVVRRVTGRPVQEHVEERLLRPLGLSRTTWVQPDHDDWARPHRVVDGVSVPEGTPLLGDGEMSPMGGLWSCVTDLARWVSWFDDAVTRPDATDWVGLSPASRREMQRVNTYIGTTTVAGRTSPAGYGFGLNLRDDHELGTVVAHAGGLPGYGSNMRWIGGTGTGAIALANATYAPMSVLTLRMLLLLHEHDEVPQRTSARTEVLDARCRALIALLNAWDDDTARALFADNMEPDDPFPRRAAAAAALLERHGPLEVVAVHASSATLGTVEVRGQHAPFRIMVELAPLAGAPVQHYSLRR